MNSRIRTVRAPNPSAMTLTGTNTYLVDGGGAAICIDPGPPIERHVDAILDAAAELKTSIGTIVLTHAHPDHAPAAIQLAQRTGAPVAAHWQSEFPHAIDLRDGGTVDAADVHLQVMESPGHTFDHLVFYEPHEHALFTGDTVLGHGYVVIAPPNGAMRPYQHSLGRLLDEFPDAHTIFGGHGEPVTDPRTKLLDYIAHRRARQAEILQALRRGPRTIPDLVAEIYSQTPPALWPAAARQLLAYLIALEEEGAVTSAASQRAMTEQEHAILNPEWESIVGREHARTVEAELGSLLRLDEVRIYTPV